MHYREQTTYKILEIAYTNLTEFSNTMLGLDYLWCMEVDQISPNNVMFQLSLDGAQLYHNKALDVIDS